MSYAIFVHETAADEIEALRAYDQRRVLAAIEEQLSQQPTGATRRRKCLVGLVPRFEHVLPIWELRVGDFRVFYDVDQAQNQVHIRAVRRKMPSETTEDIA